MAETGSVEQHPPHVLALKGVLLALWAAVAFLLPWFARDLDFAFGPWPFGYWVAAQGAVLAFIAIVAAYAVLMRRLAPGDSDGDPDPDEGVDA